MEVRLRLLVVPHYPNVLRLQHHLVPVSGLVLKKKVFTHAKTIERLNFECRISARRHSPQWWARPARGCPTPGIPAYPTASSHSWRGNAGGGTRSSSAPASSWGGSMGGLTSSGTSTSACSTTANWEAGLGGSWGVSGGVVCIQSAALGVSPRDRSEQASSASPKRFRGNPWRREKAGRDGCRPAMYSMTRLRGVSAGKLSRMDSPEGRRIYNAQRNHIRPYTDKTVDQQFDLPE